VRPMKGGGMSDAATLLGSHDVLAMAQADVRAVRERFRRRRLITLGIIVAIPTSFLWFRILAGRPFNIFAVPHFGGDPLIWVPAMLLTVLLAVVFLAPMASQRSPHVLYRPEQIDVTFDDVKGLGPVVDEVVRSLNVFLGYAKFRDELGGTPRRGLLFEGPPGTGKTLLAKAMARHAGVPFLFVAGPAFQSHWYGMTAKKIRQYFKQLKKIARKEGGAVGFIEEIDSFATARGGLDSSTPSIVAATRGIFGRVADPVVASGTGGTVNELLIQMQSFDSLPASWRFVDKIKEKINLFLPPNRQIRKRRPPYHNVLVIAATNRGDTLDPALLRPGRFDRRLYFDLPSRAGRRELVEYYLGKKKHASELAGPERRDELAAMTFGYSPVQIEHLLDEALIVALRHGRGAMTWSDIMGAKLTEDIGLPHHESYTTDERRQIATHEAGHAVAAYLIGEGRRLEVLSIVKRRDALGLLAHTDTEERFTKTRTELEALLKISLAGMSAEELFEGESGTGPAGDLAAATSIAAEMVGSLGLAGSLISFRAMSETVFDPGLVGRVISHGESKRAVDAMLKREKASVKRLLRANGRLVVALRDALLDREELIGDEILTVLDGAGGRPAQTAARRAVRSASARGRSARAASRPARRTRS
jgi:cell division protease FtsH